MEAKQFLDDVEVRYTERMLENQDITLIDTYPTITSALHAIPDLTGETFEDIKYCIQSALMESTEAFVTEYLVGESDDSYEAVVTLGWGEPENYDGEPYVSMRIKSIVRIYADFPLSALEDETALQKLLNEILSTLPLSPELTADLEEGGINE